MTFRAATSQRSEIPETLPQYKNSVWGLPAILILGLFMSTISWNKWADLIVDYGQQLYLPWQISEGKVLYRDLDYLFGPFSAYTHALLFKIFDPGIMVLAWFNLGVIAALCFLIYGLFKYFSDTLTATLATLAFLGIFAFGQYSGGGNFNFVCAYVYELAHGVFLSFLILWLFTQVLERPDRFKLSLIGLLTGLVYLTKPEVFLATTTALALGFFFLFKNRTLPKNSLLLLWGTFLVAPTLATIYFSLQMPLSEAIFYIFLPWLHVFGSSISDLPMYRWVLGTDYLGENITKMFSYLSLIAGFCLGLILLDRFLHKRTKGSPLAGWGISFLIVSTLAFWHHLFPLFEITRSLPLIILTYSVYLFSGLFNRKIEGSNQRLGLLVFSVFSLVLMFKMFFHVQVGHYGFALALPATLVLIHLLTHEIPKRARTISEATHIFRPVAITMVAIFIALHIQFEYRIYFLKNHPVGRDSDILLDYHSFLNPRGIIFNDAIDFIEHEIPRDAKFVAMPGSIILNFLTRRESSLKYVYLDPGAFLLIGDYKIYQDLQKAHPPYIVLVEQKFPQQGQTEFGKDFGKHILQWIHENYYLIQQYGAEPFKTDEFGIQILKRKVL